MSYEESPNRVVEFWTHGKWEYKQRIYKGLKLKPKMRKRRGLVKDDIIGTVIATISKGLLILGTMVSDNDINVTEWKAVNSIISPVLPRYTVGGEELECKSLWNSYKNFISRSNRRTNWWRLQVCLQAMGNEIPELQEQINTLLIRLYNKQLGRLSRDRGFNSWKYCQNQKPEAVTVSSS